MTRPTKGQRQRQKQIQWQIHLENSAILEIFDLKVKVQDSTLLNCNECQWSGKTQRVLTRHIRASHPKDFIPWSETTPLILWFLLWWTYFKWLTSRTNKKKHKNLSSRTLNVPDEEWYIGTKVWDFIGQNMRFEFENTIHISSSGWKSHRIFEIVDCRITGRRLIMSEECHSIIYY